MKIKSLVFSIIMFIVFFGVVQPVYALTIPTFPSCFSPQGTVKVTYSEGTHGIAGKTENYTGKDAVYTLTDSTLMQCYCPSEGSGIQTNWWSIPSLSDPDVKVLENQGWIYIPNGSLWGLKDTPYVAYNTEYECNSCGIGGAEVLGQGIGGDVLGLATTGNLPEIAGAFIIGFILILFGVRKRLFTQSA